MWNNPYLTSKKVAKYLHEPNKIFALTNLSDTEKLYQANAELDCAKRTKQIHLRHSQKYRLHARKTEREILQCASMQSLTDNTNVGLAEEISSTNPQLALECKTKKSVSFKDPTKLKNNHSVILQFKYYIELII